MTRTETVGAASVAQMQAGARAMLSESQDSTSIDGHDLESWRAFGESAYVAAIVRHQRWAEQEARRILAETEPDTRSSAAHFQTFNVPLRGAKWCVPGSAQDVARAALAEALARFIEQEI